MDNKLVYDITPATEFENLSAEHKKILGWVGENKKVLEFACHTGYFSSWLKKRGCEVTGAEIYAPALERAMPFLHRAVLGDIEKEAIWNEIAMEKYDAVLYMHILEHLASPDIILSKTRSLLKPGGSVIICLPNISNWDDRWKMFKGNFDYTETGVMDKTHLRFYNYFTAKKMVEDCGFNVEEYSGDSWKVRFYLFPSITLIGRINKIYNKIIHKLFKPNFTDKVLMLKCTLR